jgi:serine protease inhibitor
MKRDQIENAMNHISDSHIEEAMETRRKPQRIYWAGAVAAVLALVIALSWLPKPTAPNPGGSLAVHANAVSLSDGFRGETEPGNHKQTLRSVKTDLLRFYLESTRSVLADTTGDNRVYSPANLYIALSMASELCDGGTRQQMLDVLGVTDISALRKQVEAMWEILYTEEEYEKLVLANSLWLDEMVKYDPQVMRNLSYHHFASVYQHDLQSEAAGEAIRTWINENTGNHLQDSVEKVQMDPNTIFALYSTIYFQSRWANEFHPDSNTNDPFYSNQGIRFVTYMNRKKDQMNYYWGDDFGAVYRSLRNGSSMWFILPDDDKSVEDVLESGQFMELVTSEYWYEGWENKKYMLVNLSVPKFDISSQTSLGDDLQKLGISHAFNPEQASFPAIGGGFLTDVNQAVRVAIDEDGVVAAAYTELLAGAAMPPEEIMDFKLDRPFLFVIVKQQIPLFTGVVNAP